MILDYTQPEQGILAQKVLAAAGIAAVLTPYKLLDRGIGVDATLIVVHRVAVPVAEAGRAAAALDKYGLLIRRAD
jgi:hypothetical protein